MNAAVLLVAFAILAVSPMTVSSPLLLREAVILVGGLCAMLVVNVLLTRRALVPLNRLSALMGDVDLLSPGQRIPIYREAAEVVELTRSFNAMLERLEEERRQSVRRATTAQETDRRRIAQELHDAVGQALTVVLMQLDRAAHRVGPEERAMLASAQDTVRSGIDDIRRIVAELRPEALDDLGLRSALSTLAQRLSDRTGIAIERHLDPGLGGVREDVELVVYRIAQEALTNAVRHSGAARVNVALARTDRGLRLRVSDDGTGLPGAVVPGSGMHGMRERAVMVGGDLRVVSRRGEGVEVLLDVDTRRAA